MSSESESLLIRKTTPWGGRGFYAATDIPKGSLIHTAPRPYASTIYRVFRKEVCAECLAYAYDSNRNTWNVRYADPETGYGIWFCSERCKDAWVVEEARNGCLLTKVFGTVDRMDQSMKKNAGKAKASSTHPVIPTGKIEETTRESLDRAWKDAELLPVTTPIDVLDELELDTARFVLSGIVKRYLEDSRGPEHDSDFLSWASLLDLQDNELNIHPSILESHLRVYAFLRRAALPTALGQYVEKMDTIRSILARDYGNVFGYYDKSISGDSEMLGFGLYITASYFNHGQLVPSFILRLLSYHLVLPRLYPEHSERPCWLCHVLLHHAGYQLRRRALHQLY